MPENYLKKAPFRNILSIAKTNIALLLMDNNDIIRLLKYNTADALDDTNPVTDAIRSELFSQSSPNRRVFLTAYNGEPVTDERSELHISYDSVGITYASAVKTPILKIDVVVADPINPLSDGMSMRHDYLFQSVCDTIEGNLAGAVGYLSLTQSKEWILQDNSFIGWTAFFEIGEVRV